MYTSPLIFAARILDAKWDEDKHPRKTNGQFGKGSVQPKSPLRQAAEIIQPKRRPIKLGRREYARVMSAINTNYSRFKNDRKGFIAVENYVYYFYNNGFDDYKFYKKTRL